MNSSTSSSETFTSQKWLTLSAAALAVCLFTFFAASELLIRTKVEPNDLFQKKRALFFAAEKEDAVFGDSHASFGFTGAAGFVNLAYPSEPVEVIEAKIKSFVARRPLRKVILQADPHMFSPYHEKTTSDFFITLYQSEAREPVLFFSPRHRKNLLKYWGVFLRGKNFSNKYHWEPDGANTSNENWAAIREADRIHQAAERVRQQTPAPNFETSEALKRYEEILKFLKEKNVRACLATFPVTPEYVKNSAAVPAFRAARETFSGLANQYGFPYGNYWGAVSDPSLFANADHLNRTGALFFSKRAVEDCFTDGI